MLSVAVARFSSDGKAIRYVLPVLWITCFLYNGANRPNQRRHHVSCSSPGGSTRAKSAVFYCNLFACSMFGLWTNCSCVMVNLHTFVQSYDGDESGVVLTISNKDSICAVFVSVSVMHVNITPHVPVISR